MAAVALVALACALTCAARLAAGAPPRPAEGAPSSPRAPSAASRIMRRATDAYGGGAFAAPPPVVSETADPDSPRPLDEAPAPPNNGVTDATDEEDPDVDRGGTGLAPAVPGDSDASGDALGFSGPFAAGEDPTVPAFEDTFDHAPKKTAGSLDGAALRRPPFGGTVGVVAAGGMAAGPGC